MKQVRISYRYQVLIYFLLLLTAISLAFVYILVKKDKELKTDRLVYQMLPYTDIVYKNLSKTDFSNKDSVLIIMSKLKEVVPSYMRVTLINSSGEVLFDNSDHNDHIFDNHLSRPEIVEAKRTGQGNEIRLSSSMNKKYLYFAKKFDSLYIRTALEYDRDILPVIEADRRFQIYIALLFLGIILSIIYITRKVSMPVSAFKEFIDMVQHGSGDYKNIQFPNNEFGDVGEKIINTFAQLEKTKKFKQELTHNIAHELKTPVTGIRGYLETLLHQDNLDKEKSRFFLERAYAQCMRLSSIISDIAVLNKIEEAADKFNIEDVNIRECIKEIENDLAFKFEEKKINFTADIDNSLVIKGSNFLIYSLFKNLIDNSLEHAGENISINISYKGTKDGKVHFEYFDTGKGVSEKHIERIFERFYRVEEGRTRKSGGSGLGLSIVKNSVSLHKGTISVKNREGGGLLFTLTLSSEL